MRDQAAIGSGMGFILGGHLLSFCILLFLGSAGSSRAQVEPGEFTVLRAAVTTNPPNAARILGAVKSLKIERDLGKVWLTEWKFDTNAFEALEGCFNGAEEAHESARRLVVLRDRTLSDEEIDRAADDLIDQLKSLPKADLKKLREFVASIRLRLEKN